MSIVVSNVMADSDLFPCATCMKTFASSKGLKIHVSRSEQCSISTTVQTQTETPDNFGNEVIEPMLGKLHHSHLSEMVKNPEDAITQDIPNLTFFNLEFPRNQTLLWRDDAPIIFQSNKWKSVKDNMVLLKTVARHFKKVLCHAKVAGSVLSSLDIALANEYIVAIDDGKDVAVSQYCPFYHRVEGGIISISRLLDALLSNIRANSDLGKEHWVHTIPYVVENFDP